MGTHYHGSPEATRALDAYIKLVRAAESVIARVHRSTNCDLTVSQFGVMEALLHLGPMHQRMLGAKLLKSGGNVTMVIDNLERRELVERRRDLQDRRYVTVHLTPAGKALISEIFPRHVASIQAELAALEGPEQDAIARLCRKVGRAAG